MANLGLYDNEKMLLDAVRSFTIPGKLAQNPGFSIKTRLHQQPFAKGYTKDISKKDGVERVLLGTAEAPKVFERAYNDSRNLGKAIVAADDPFYNHYAAGSPYGIYNWEIDFHLPLLIANRLSQTQRYEEAQRWYHFIFNPTQTKNGNAWVFKPFKDEKFNTIDELLSDNDHRDFQSWFENPFLPHAIASFRIEAYMMYTLMKYIDNLIEWGDNLFRRDTIESINEATQYYVLASSILGPKPKAVPKKGATAPLTYAQIKDKRNGNEPAVGLSNPHVDVPSGEPSTTDRTAPEISGASTLFGIVQNVGYFGIPANKKLLEYWDKVADRLFKIRHCQNIEGIVRELPLFEPPIDPAMLIRAAQAGLDLGAVINDLYAPMPHYRFQVMLQKANEYCNEIKAFGNALLSALEKKDNEQLSIIRARHEQNLLALMRIIKENQRKDAELSLEGLKINHKSASFRFKHYEKMLGKDTVVPEYNKEEIKDIEDLYPQGFSRLVIQGNEGINIMNEEKQELHHNDEMKWKNEHASIFEFIAGLTNLLPNISVGAGPVSFSFGGSNLGAAFSAIANIYRFESAKNGIEASKLAKIGSWILRQDEWMQQSRAAALEINQLKRQMLAADLRAEIAKREIENHEQQIQNTQEVLDFITGDESVVKFTSNATLYNWMVGQLMMLYRQSYKMAHDLAKQAERCYRYELGVSDSNFIQFNYWDDDKKGLLAGDRLSNALKQMEKAYMDQNQRDFEITKHISLNQLDPFALLALRESGTCSFRIPEELFDMDFPGHYFRRIKSVSISIPCIAGPYSSVNATLRLTANKIRKNATNLPEEQVSTQAVATSSAQNDSGLFELNFRDERYIPFEGAGAISDWSLEMQNEFRQFDYDTISDVIVHLRYTAKEDNALKDQALANLHTLLTSPEKTGLFRLFSLRTDFSNEWHRWKTGNNLPLEVKLEKRHFPYFAQVADIKYGAVEVISNPKTGTPQGQIEANGKLTVTGLDIAAQEAYVLVQYSLSGVPPLTTGGGTPPSGGVAELKFMGFRHTVSAESSNNWTAPQTILDHASLNGQANVRVFVMPDWGPGTGGVGNEHPLFVEYRNDRWRIVHTDGAAMSVGYHFNILVAPELCPHAFVHEAQPDTLQLNRTYIDHPACNGKSNARLLVTPAAGINRQKPIGVSYDAMRAKWFIFNAVGRADETNDVVNNGMVQGSKFNVMALNNDASYNLDSFVHGASEANIVPVGSHITFMDHSAINSKPNALIFATMFWQGQDEKLINNANFMLWYDDPNDPWHHKDGSWSLQNTKPAGKPMPVGAAFHVFVFKP